MTAALSRRAFIGTAAAGTAGLVLGFRLPTGSHGAPGTVNAWLRIDGTGVAVLTNTSEIGQGSNSSIAMLVAEELDVPWSLVRVEMAPLDKAYFNPGTFGYATFGSLGVRGQFDALRKAGAAARTMLIEAAATRWVVPREQCAAAQGMVRHPVKGGLAYAELAAAAAQLPVPADPPLKPRSDWKLIGRPAARLDLPAKVDGSARYGVDVRRPGLLVATIAQCPVQGGRLADVDEQPALAIKGVKRVVRLPDAVAVVATGYWLARKGLDSLQPQWATEGLPKRSSAAIAASMRDAVRDDGTTFVPEGGNADAIAQAVRDAFTGAPQRHSAVYEAPFLAHATMEPQNATADVRPDRAEIWAPTQTQSVTRTALAQALKLPEDKIALHTTLSGGGFGRRLEFDFVIQAALISRAVGAPVKLIWSREEDTQHDFYRPAATARLEAGLDRTGRPLAFRFVEACGSPLAHTRPGMASPPPFDTTSIQGIFRQPYALGTAHLSWAPAELGVRVGFWRSVGASQNCFFLEGFIDELAARAGADPVAYRRALLSGSPRALAVFDRVAEASGWNRPLPRGRGRGIAMVQLSNSIVAQVVEASVADDKTITVHRVTCAFDCGLAVNPDAVRAQAEGSIIFGLTAAMHGEITFRDGAVEQANFDTQPLVTLAQCPEIDIYLVESDNLGGAGEEAVPPLAPALANAIFAATGERIRRLPLAAHGYGFA